MRPRLLRALQQGGCAAQGSAGRWKVYRQRDLRGRIIGEVCGSDMDALLAEGFLKPFGRTQPERLVWSGPVERSDVAHGPFPQVQATVSEATSRPRSLLARILTTCPDPAQRRRLAHAALSFRQDVEASEDGTSKAGMNWQSISAGTRLDGGRTGEGYSAIALDARARLARVLESFPETEAQRLLILTVVRGASRRQVALRTGLSPREAESEAARQISRLAVAYDLRTARPDQV